MTRTIALKLPSGRTVLTEIEAGDGEWQQMAAGAKGTGVFEDSIQTLREMLESAASGLDRIGPRRPDTVTLELSVELASGGVIKLLGGSAKGGLKVSMTWKGAPGTAT